MHILTKVLNHFIPTTAHCTPIKLRRASILVFSHLFFLAGIIITILSSAIVHYSINNLSLVAIPIIVLSLLYFKKTGNTTVAGNFLAFALFLTFVPALVTTGGVYSCYIHWVFSLPLIMALLKKLDWALFWVIIAFGSYTAMYIAGFYYPEINQVNVSTGFHLLSLFVVGIYIFVVFLIFESSQSFSVKLLKARNDELTEREQKLGVYTQELETIKNKLTESNQELQNFAYTASHDLKEPLRMIGMYTQLIQKRLKQVDDDRIKEYMYFVTDGVKRMQKLLDDLLQYSRLGKNTNDIKEIDLNESLFNVVQNLTALLKETEASIVANSMPKVTASVTEISQLFQNLIANAIKFRKKDVHPDIQIGYINEPTEHFFAVRDNGIGIKEEHQAKVFDIFTKLHTRNEYEGAGIGLATCKKIITNLGGRIWLESTEGVGTTFYFTIPKENKLMAAATEKGAEVPQLQNTDLN